MVSIPRISKGPLRVQIHIPLHPLLLLSSALWYVYYYMHMYVHVRAYVIYV